MSPKNLIYFGSPEFSAQILKSIIKNSPPYEGGDKEGVCRVVAVCTQSDKPLGRKQIMTPSPVAITASLYDLPVFKPEKLDDANLSHLKLLKPDIFLVVSYGKIIPKTWLTAPTIGCFNLHFSLLPKYRGALCISEAIKNQDHETGVTLMVMDKGLDTGPIISQSKITIDINDNCETLTNKLTQEGIKLLSQYLPLLISGKYQITPQDNSIATYTPTTKSRSHTTAFIPWPEIQYAMSHTPSAMKTHALIRSLNPDPGAWTKIPVSSSQNKVSSEIEIKIIKTKLDTKYLILDTIQLPGKQPISWQNFLSGHRLSL